MEASLFCIVNFSHALYDRSRSRSWSPGRQKSPSRDRKAVKIEEPSMELLRIMREHGGFLILYC